jgi:hypothetical protein
MIDASASGAGARTRRHRGPAIAAGLSLLLAAAFVLTLPPRAVPAPGGAWRPHAPVARARGVLHVHTRRSDGSGSVDDVARAAGRAGLDFVVLADHGDGTRPPDPPAYRAGVLCLDAVEISTADGHVLALGLPATPFRLAGRARDVVEDISRFGGLAFATHPDSPKPALAWRDWAAPLHGFEWLNADTEWRDERGPALLAALAHYWLRGPETIAGLFDRPSGTLARWDAFSQDGRPLVALAGADAHARLGWTDDDAEGESREPERRSLAVPSYETVFETATTHVELERRFGGDAAADAELLLRGIAAGRTFTTIDAYARGGVLEFAGEAGGRPVAMGARVPPGTLSRLTARVRAPASASLRLLRNGVVVAQTSGLSLEVPRAQFAREHAGNAGYRVEVLIAGRGAADMPWIIGNPIWEAPVPSGSDAAEGALGHGRLALARDFGPSLRAAAWTIEADSRSSGRLTDEGGGGLGLVFQLGEQRADRWVAAAFPLDDEARALLRSGAALSVRLRGSAPMRVAVQLRAEAQAADEDLRWSRSLFVTATPRTALVPLDSLHPVSPEAAARHPAHATTLLVVVDGTHSEPGRRGTVWIDALSFVR